jgi:hypothetical protein
VNSMKKSKDNIIAIARNTGVAFEGAVNRRPDSCGRTERSTSTLGFVEKCSIEDVLTIVGGNARWRAENLCAVVASGT